jgi:hypothetical protein
MNFVAILGLTQISRYSGIFVLNTSNIGPKEYALSLRWRVKEHGFYFTKPRAKVKASATVDFGLRMTIRRQGCGGITNIFGLRSADRRSEHA